MRFDRVNILFVALITLCAAESANAVIYDATYSGQYDNTGSNSLFRTYTAGDLGTGLTYRNWFTFDFTNGSPLLRSAILKLYCPTAVDPQLSGYYSIDPSEIYTMFDVTTLLAELTASGTGKTSVYNDLGSGNQLGSVTVSSDSRGTFVNIPFNADGMTYLNQHRFGVFAIGGAITTLDAVSNKEFVFAKTTFPVPNYAQLDVVRMQGGRWLNLTSNWSDFISWQYSAIPTAVDETVFDLNSTYTVNFSAPSVAKVMSILAGNVTFSLATKTLDVGDSISIASGAKAIFSHGKVTAKSILGSGTLNIDSNGEISIAPNGGASGVSIVKSMNIVNSRLDLHNNDLVVDFTGGNSPYNSIVSSIKNGLKLINGIGSSGIGSSEVDAQTLPGTILGVVDGSLLDGGITSLSGFTAFNPNKSVLIKYTWFGDANLDGTVDGSDYALVDTGFTSSGLLVGWVYGDFDYNGLVNSADYALIDTGFIAQSGSLPEPASLSLLTMGMLTLLRRRNT